MPFCDIIKAMNKYVIWLTEAFIWTLIIITVIMGSFLYKHKKLKQKHSYHVFFSDTNGLKNGSPVKLMGVEVGYITHVKIVNSDEIFVSFVITAPNISIPLGARATIESTGLVGSRSLELYPPKTNIENTQELVFPYNPERVSGTFENSTKIADIIYYAANNVNKIIPIEQIPSLRYLIHTTSKEITTYPSKINSINNYENKIIEFIENNQAIKNFNKKMEELTK